MQPIVSTISNGKYAEVQQLFAEPISDDNVKLMGEMIALRAIQNVLPYDFMAVSKLYKGLIKDLNRISQIDYTITDGYDYAQTAICFLYQFKGMYVSDIYGKDRLGKFITIKTACFRAVDRELSRFRGTIAQNRQFELNHNKQDIPDPRDCFEDKTDTYTKFDALIEKMCLTEHETEVLYCYMNGMGQSEVAEFSGLTIHQVRHKKNRIREKYNAYAKELVTT